MHGSGLIVDGDNSEEHSLFAAAPGNADLVNDVELLAEGAVILRGFARDVGKELLLHIAAIAGVSPFRHLIMANGMPMAVAITNCGPLGWISTVKGYRYSSTDPMTGRPWPGMPASFHTLAVQAAHAAGFEGFNPGVCIINRYTVGTHLHMHQDRDETRDAQPVVSVSLGLPAKFRFGGQGKGQPARLVPLEHGDVAVWGGRSRMAYHGIAPLEPGTHPLTGDVRLNLTFRTTRIAARQRRK